MTLSASGSGSGGNAVSATSIACATTSTMPVGALAVLVIAYDNSGTSGADPYSSISDSVGNTWTARDNNVNVGASSPNTGTVLRFFTSLLTAAITSSDTITVSFGAVSVPSKAFLNLGVVSDAGTPSYKTGATATANAGAGTTSTITTGTITNGNMIFGALALEWDSSDIPAGDADTTNGSWGAQQNSSVGTTAAGQQINYQRKVVTATGAQTYNVTSNPDVDRVIGWIEIEELVTASAAAFRPLVPTEAIRRAARW